MKENMQMLKVISMVIIVTFILLIITIWSSLFVSKYLHPWRDWDIYEDIGTYNDGFIVSVKTGHVWKYVGDFRNGDTVTMTITDMGTSNIKDDDILKVKKGVDMYGN